MHNKCTVWVYWLLLLLWSGVVGAITAIVILSVQIAMDESNVATAGGLVALATYGAVVLGAVLFLWGRGLCIIVRTPTCGTTCFSNAETVQGVDVIVWPTLSAAFAGLAYACSAVIVAPSPDRPGVAAAAWVATTLGLMSVAAAVKYWTLGSTLTTTPQTPQFTQTPSANSVSTTVYTDDSSV